MSKRPLLPLILVLLNSCQSAGEPTRDQQPSSAQPESSNSFEAQVADLEHHGGLFDLWSDSKGGRLLLGITPQEAQAGRPSGWLAECLYVEGLAAGLGSNDVGLDRGQIGPTRHVHFRRMGNALSIEAENHDYRAHSNNPAEQRAALESFATSVLWSGEIAAEAADGRVLVDITDFVVRDAHGSARSLGASGGSWRMDPKRSFVEPQGLFVFPDNIELEARLTFAGEGASREIREVVPDSGHVTLVQHHSFVRLPDDGYRPRAWDPRAGAFSTSYMDVAAAPGEPNRIELVDRFRLAKRNPELAVSEAIEPIIYYVDGGAPEPVRSALIEGASWWNEAFEAAGYRDAFQVRLLPEGVHPLDVRYNVIQWVHRSSRGWSYGGGVTDPRTGERIKGHVVLGSLRVRQDRLIFEGLVGTRWNGTGQSNDPIEAALARIRQLSAHEVGHTLGLAHNFAASTYDGRASVMDYPAPLISKGAAENSLDLSRAYAVGIGSWDRFAISHLYAHSAPGASEAEHLAELVTAAHDQGLVYLSDGDARPAGASEARANLWDNGSDPLTELEHLLEVRRIALQNFGPDRLAAGQSRALYGEVLIPLFFLHRYQVDAVAKLIGGEVYDHPLVGDGRALSTRVAASRQRLALQRLLEAARVTADLPDHVAALLAPETLVGGRRREAFEGRSDPRFDRVGLAEASMGQVLGALLQPQRLERVDQQQRFDPAQLGLEELFLALQHEVIEDAQAKGGRLDGVLAGVALEELIKLSGDPRASWRVRGASEATLERLLLEWTQDSRGNEWPPRPFVELRRVLGRYLRREFGESESGSRPRELPPGSPIGCSQG